MRLYCIPLKNYQCGNSSPICTNSCVHFVLIVAPRWITNRPDCLSNPILFHTELICCCPIIRQSQIELKKEKFNMTNSWGANRQQMQEEHPGPLLYCWTVCFSIHWLCWDRKSSRYHWNHRVLIMFYCLVWLVFIFTFLDLHITYLYLYSLKVVMQKIQC